MIETYQLKGLVEDGALAHHAINITYIYSDAIVHHYRAPAILMPGRPTPGSFGARTPDAPEDVYLWEFLFPPSHGTLCLCLASPRVPSHQYFPAGCKFVGNRSPGLLPPSGYPPWDPRIIIHLVLFV